MSDRKIKRALIAVYDKTGIADFARALVDEFGVEIISTGGTAKHLKDAGIPVTLVEEVTGFPEMLDGRVKTLHPKIHAAILADRDNPDHMRQLAEQGIEPIDMVVVNLYPFEKTVADPNCTFEQAIEMIDIGGPCMLRAAAKNCRHVTIIDNPRDYELSLNKLRKGYSREDWSVRCTARDAFMLTAWYDAQISAWISRMPQHDRTSHRFLRLFDWGELRYGENPHQRANVLSLWGKTQIDGVDIITGDLLGEFDVQATISLNNYLDADAAFGLCAELARACQHLWRRFSTGSPQLAVCNFIKHTNACGVGVAVEPHKAYQNAYLGDPNAAMGGILACSFDINPDFATTVMETYDRYGKAAGAGGFFVEVWVAPSFDEKAVEIIRTKKKWGANVRLLAVGDMTVAPDPNELDYKRIAGGMLVQTRDLVGLNEYQWKVVTKREPSETEISDLRLAWLIAKHTKSNAISICKDGMLIGNGAGQMSRVMSCRIATWLAKENGHEGRLKGAAAASDAFFPFRDGPDILMDAGVTAIIQPGGSKRDEQVIAACDERGAAMIFTGTRHFKH